MKARLAYFLLATVTFSVFGWIFSALPASATECCVCTDISEVPGPDWVLYKEGTAIYTENGCSAVASSCLIKEFAACPVAPTSEKKMTPVSKISEEFKFGNIVLGIAIPGLKFSPPPAEVDEQGKIYIPWLAEYLKAIYNYAVVIISIVGVVAIVVQAIRIITSAGGAAKADAYKKITQIIIGLFIAWGSYTILYTINPGLTKFKPLEVQFIETVPLITVIEEPIVPLPTESAPPAPASGKAPSKVPDYKQFSKQWGGLAFGPSGARICTCGSKSSPGPDRSVCDKTTDQCCTNIQASGCGPTSLAMVLSAYGAANATPDKVAAFVGQEGNGRICNKGTSMGVAISNLKDSAWSDFKGKAVTKDQALALLKEKKPIIFLCIKCTGTSKNGTNNYGGHYMVLTSADDSGNVKVNDPGCNQNCAINSMTSGQLDSNKGFWYVYR